MSSGLKDLLSLKKFLEKVIGEKGRVVFLFIK